MRPLQGCIVLSCLLLGTAGCDRPENTDDRRTQEEKTDQAARKAGEDAYKVTQKTKEVTQEAVEKLKKAGREVREGWEDAKHNDPDQDSTRPKQ
jgi:hypothetical protein